MCTVCGCGEGQATIKGKEAKKHTHSHDHAHDDGDRGHSHSHAHDHDHDHDHDHAHSHGHEHQGHDHHHYGKGPAHAHAPGLSQSRMIQIETDILAKNNEYASANRRTFQDKGIFALNLVSSPGSGKTTLLTRIIHDMKTAFSISVIEGDQQTENDAQRIRETGARAVQVNTGKGCHLDGHMVGHALEHLAPEEGSLLFIENVGNLVCPAGFDLGEAHKVVILSVTEGEDKPIKYPDMFHASDLMLLTKTDLLPHLDFDVEKCMELALRVNPKIKILQLSAKSGEGMDDFAAWIKASRAARFIGHPSLNAVA